MKQILLILLVLIIAATISICTVQPDMHKSVIVYDSDYTLVAEQDVKKETKEVPVMEKTTEPVTTVTKVEKVSVQKPAEKDFKQIVSKVEKQTTPVSATKVQTKKTETPKTTTVTKPVTTKVEKPVVTKVTKTETPKVEKTTVTKPVQKTAVIQTTTQQPKVMTQQEETIAWNTWRSNLQNKIMQDTKMPNLPTGTVFQFSFTVDKYGKITNVHTGANPSTYTPYAIQYIAPVIRSYQGREILNFPEGTARTVTEVTGKWRISNTERYSTPQDFNDIEKVIR